MIKIICGTRPEIIKLFPLIKELDKRNIMFHVLFTNQHFSKNMSLDFFKEFGISSRVLSINETFSIVDFLNQNIKVDDKIIVQGDTRSVYYGALISNLCGAKVYHVEAGLRTGDFNSPFPEELYRVEVSKLAFKHFTPTINNKNNLLNEGIDENNIIVCGNTIMQSLEMMDVKPNSKKNNQVLVTLHRTENKKFMHTFAQLLIDLANKLNCKMKVVVHPNNYLKDGFKGLNKSVPKNLSFIKPLGYKDFLEEINKSRLLITDSGGIQEECCYLKTQCVVLRDTTERMEAVDNGFAVLIKPSTVLNVIDNIVKLYEAKIDLRGNINPYYDKDCINKIIEEIVKK